MGRDLVRGHHTGTALVIVAISVLLIGCGNMLAPSPDGVMWLRECRLAQLVHGEVIPVADGDEFCPATIEVAGDGTVWAAEGAQVRRLEGSRWVQVRSAVGGEPTIDLAVGTTGEVWLVTGTETESESLAATIHRYENGEWTTYSDASGESFGTIEERFEPPSRILARLDEERMALVTHSGLYVFDGRIWERVVPGDFTSISAADDGTLWMAGTSGIFSLSPDAHQ